MQSSSAPVKDNVSTEIASMRSMLQHGQLHELVSIAKTILDRDANNSETLYLLAVAQRYLNQSEKALDTLNKLIESEPLYARAYQERAYNYKAQGKASQAKEAFEKAIKHNPALLSSWRELVVIYRAEGMDTSLRIAEAESQRLASLPGELLSVSSMIYENKLYKAEQLCREFLRKHKHHVEAMRLLAILAVKQFVYSDAEFLLESCVEFEPDNWLARNDYVTILYKRQQFEKALEHANILRQRYPGNLAFDMSYANQHVALGQFDIALTVYDDIITKHPHLEMPHLMRGHALKTVGRLEEGIAAYRSSYQARPDFGDAYWSLANLKTYRFTDDEIVQMQRQLEKSDTVLEDRFHLSFALGKAFEDREDFAQSFHYYEKGNSLKKTQLRYKPEIHEYAMQQQIEHCNVDFFQKVAGFGCDRPDPIFIVGLPRAGSTLLEQILASHSQVEGTQELHNIIALSRRLNGTGFIDHASRYPSILHELSREHCKRFGEEYIRDTQCHRQSAPYFIDKMPNNFMHIGLIHAILPNAKIIDARRHPMACCFSGFKQLFADGQEFSYGLDEISRYYLGYIQLMDHWDKVLPGKILRVHYEQVVDDLETQVHRILDFCQLPFEETCIEFHKTKRSVRTPSSEQVRQPIYKTGVEQWRHFEPYLDVLKDNLQSVISTYPTLES